MLFNSSVFLQFFAAFLLLHHLCRRHLVARNLLILVASYVFYGWWDYRFLALLFLTSLLDYVAARGIEAASETSRRRLWLAVSLTGNLGVLGFFKYFNFFVDSFGSLLSELGLHAEPRTLGIILPVGISFYTFQSLSYSLDVYRGRIRATKNLLNFLAYVAFFPQLVAGPIERARHLLPQFESPRVITRTDLGEGLWLVLWGLFKKVVIADNLAPLVELVYQHPTDSGPAVILGTLAFAFQIYGDFSGYSDIARGLARWLGFDLMVNFNLPYFATSPREFWRRWHISLSTWLRDYLYISLGGNRGGPWRTRLNLMLTMLLGGLWHGASWHFVLWGGWHGLGLVMTRKERSLGNSGAHQNDVAANWCSPKTDPTHPVAANWRSPGSGDLPGNSPRRTPVRRYAAVCRYVACAGTFLFVLYGWLLFRASSWEQVVTLTQSLAQWTWPVWAWNYVWGLTAFVGPLLLIQVWQVRAADLLAPAKASWWLRGTLQAAMLLLIIAFWEREAAPFIYFQF